MSWISRLRGLTAVTGIAIIAGLVATGSHPVANDHHAEAPEEDGTKSPNPWFFTERAYPFDSIPRDQWRRARQQAQAFRAAFAGINSWEQRGPTNIGGRITDLVVHPTNDDIVYVGAAEGGVLKTTDAGQSWTPLFDDQSTLSVGTVALDPNDPETVFVGTGEVNPGGGSVAYGGDGVFKSTDGGATWTHIGLEDSGSIGRLRIDPTNSDVIFAAVTGHLWETGQDRGVYRTTNGGTTWERVHFVNDETGCVDLIMRPDDPDVLYAAMWERLRQPEAYDYGGIGCGVYRTVDGGDTWSLVAGGLPAPSANGGRIGLSLCNAQPDVMHVVYADRVGFFDGLYRSTDGGFTWNQTNDGSLSNVFASYGWWFGNVRTHPVNPNIIFVVGFDVYRSTNGGASYSYASGSMHVDHHGFDFGPGASPVMYNGNDGGVYRSTNGGTSWTKLFELPVTQAYRIALDPNNDNALFLGSQDNGTCRTVTGALDDWSTIYGGDGFQPLIHPNNSNRMWAQFQYGNVAYSSNGGNSWSGAGGGISGSDRKNWNAPHIQDPTDADTRYFGTNRLYRNTSNTSWTVISPDLTGGTSGNNGQVSGTLTTAAVSPLDGDIIWTGSDDGRVHVTSNGGNVWTDRSAGLPDRWITSVRTDPFDADTAYVTVSGFRWAEPLPHVYRTTNLGATWEPIAGNLPEAPANDFIADPVNTDRYFVATDVGVYQTWNGGTTWSLLGLGLPNVVVTSLAYRATTEELYAGTYGRSVFSIDVTGVACPWDVTGDDIVGIDDLLAFLVAWGSDDPQFDFNGDEDVNAVDLLELLSNWGPCS